MTRSSQRYSRLYSPPSSGDEADGEIHHHVPHPVNLMASGNSRRSQIIEMEEGDLKVKFTGYKGEQKRWLLYYALCILSLGCIYLFSRWFPKFWKKLVNLKETNFVDATWIMAENSWGEILMIEVSHTFFNGSILDVFPQTMKENKNWQSNSNFYHSKIEETSEEPTTDTDLMDDRSANLTRLKFFEYRCVKFVFQPEANKFVDVGKFYEKRWEDLGTVISGLEYQNHQNRITVFGENLINIKEQSTTTILVNEVLHPFNLFQIFSIVLWSSDEYYYYAICIFIISVVSILTTLNETKKNMRKLREMARYSCSTRICRAGKTLLVDSTNLVPGDIIEINISTMGHLSPCDILLLKGDCIINESMLTGESLPVSKIPMSVEKIQDLKDFINSGKAHKIDKCVIFAGTKIVRARGTVESEGIKGGETPFSNNDDTALGLVIRTGFNTTKGHLVRSILHPKPIQFKFFTDAFKFLQVMSSLAGIGFLFTLIIFFQKGIPFNEMIVRALDLVTIVVPPALPATMSIGTSFALSQLRKINIFCISPNRINFCGKLNLFCFDKTGTLTEEGLDVLGVRMIRKIEADPSKSYVFAELIRDVDLLPRFLRISDPTSSRKSSHLTNPFIHALSTCHSIHQINGELIGDPLDLKMFEFTKWILEEGGCKGAEQHASNSGSPVISKNPSIIPTTVRPPGVDPLTVADIAPEYPNSSEMDQPISNENTFRSYSTEDNLNTSSCEFGILKRFEFVSKLCRMSVVVKELTTPGLQVFTKGAPEVIKQLCSPETIPDNYDDLLNEYTHHGYRVIACSRKKIGKLNLMKLEKLKRSEVECNLEFLGFIIFENKLKKETIPAIRVLKNARIRQTMITGDNVLTAISVSRECGIVDPDCEIYVPRRKDSTTSTDDLNLPDFVWENVEDSTKTLDPLTLELSRRNSNYIHQPYTEYTLAVTGDILSCLHEHADLNITNMILHRGQIFARVSPEQKQDLVEKFQQVGYCVGFCGDGANDCGALKAANVGISLSEAEASVAAPFTSRSTNIECVLELIREGRAALVTSFSCFKYMAMYSLIQFTSVTLMYTLESNLGDSQFLFIDLAIILPIAVFMSQTKACKGISAKRPPSRLISPRVVVSLIGQLMIQLIAQMFVFFYVKTEEFYKPSLEGEHKPMRSHIKCYENTSIFLLTLFQYIFTAIIFSSGPPFRQSMATNRPYLITTAALYFICIYFTLFSDSGTRDFFQLQWIPIHFRFTILFVVVIYMIMGYVAEQWLFPFGIKMFFANRRSRLSTLV